MSLPPLDATGNLEPGIYRCTATEVMQRFAIGSARRRLVGLRLQRILALLSQCEHVARIIVFGSFVTSKPDPADVDVFLVMEDSFDLVEAAGELRIVFDHAAAQSRLGASIFWVRRTACFPSEDEMVAGWGQRRDGAFRGIIEITKDRP